MGGRLGLFVLGWVMVLAGALLAHLVQTSGGVRVVDVRYPSAGGERLAALLYVPPTATIASPAPAVMVSHGYINSREMQIPFAIELARRGFVVLSIDMTGHGYSGGAVGAEGGGGPDGLKYLQGLPFVNPGQIGLEGHSMGGVAIVDAALSQPAGYRSMVLEGSTTPDPGQVGMGSPAFPHNLEVVFGRYDEFAPLMWRVAKGADVGGSAKLKALFGTTAPVVPGRVHGSLADGSARLLVIPPITHPLEHFSSAGVGAAVDWFQRTLKGEASPMLPDDQIWPWREVGSLIALVGFAVLILGSFKLLLATRYFSELRQAPEPTAARRGPRWIVDFILTATIPALIFYPLMNLGFVFFPSRLFPQWVTNQLLVWALATGAISLALSFVPGAAKPAFAHRWVKSILIALASVAVGYLALAVCDALFKVDFRFWVVGLKLLDGRRFLIALAYLAQFTVALGMALRTADLRLPIAGESPAWACLWAATAMSAGFVVLLGAQYAVMVATGALITPKEALSTIIAIQFIPVLAFVGVVGAYTFGRTNSYLPGAAICGLVVTWYIVAGTAIHWSPGWQIPKSAGLYPDRPLAASTTTPGR